MAAVWMMFLLAVLFLLSGCASTFHRDDPLPRVTLTGVLSFPADHEPRLQDCGSKQVVRLGEMARGPYLHLRRRVREIGAAGTQPVTAEISGYLRRAGEDLLVDDVAVHGLAPGRCRNIVDYGDIDY